MITWKTLYKLSSTGKIHTWQITAEELNLFPPIYTITHGQQGGKLQSTTTVVAEGKNIGRANETTPWTQCKLEADSLWKKQLERKGYTTQIPTSKPFRPMLAKSYWDDGYKIKFPCYVQPKLDGIRCLAFWDASNNTVVLVSRQGKEFSSMTHIEAALRPLFKQYPNLVLDGELYLHDENFQDIVSAIKRDEANADSAKIEYHIYDTISDDDYTDRMKLLESLFLKKPLHRVTTLKARNAGDLEYLHTRMTRDGYEGIMLRNYTGGYTIDKRSDNLQKYKKFLDAEFPIVDAYENKGKQAGQCTFVCRTKEGRDFGVKPEGTDEVRRRYWQDWRNGTIQSGALLTVKFFSYSKDGVPRFPVGITIRDYE